MPTASPDRRTEILMRLAETVETWGWDADEDFHDIADAVRGLARRELSPADAHAIAEAQIERLRGGPQG